MNSDKFTSSAGRVLYLIGGIAAIVLAYFILHNNSPGIWETIVYLKHQTELAGTHLEDPADFRAYAQEKLIKSLLATGGMCASLLWAGFKLLRMANIPDTDSADADVKPGWASRNISVHSLLNMKSLLSIIGLVFFCFCVLFGINKNFPSLLNLGGNIYLDDKTSSGGTTAMTQSALSHQAAGTLMGGAIQTTPSVPSAGEQLGGAIQGKPLNLSAAVSTLVIAETRNAADSTSKAASFNQPHGIATDGSNLYVADSGNNKIRKIVIATGVVSTLAGSGTAGSADGTGVAAAFDNPRGIATDGSNLYVADSGNDIIRKIVIATGEVTTLAGTAHSSGFADGAGAAASFFYPRGIATDGSNLFVADSGNHKIRKIVIATGAVSTLAGGESSGSADGIGTAASFNSPEGIATDRSNLYVADTYNHRIRKITIATGTVSTLAGSGKGFADGKGTAALFNQPNGITIDGADLYVADNGNNTFRKIVISTGEVITPEGKKTPRQPRYSRANAYADMDENSYKPFGITIYGGNLYVTDAYHHTIRKIVISIQKAVPAGTPAPAYKPWGMEVATLAGTGTAGAVDNAVTTMTMENNSFNHPAGVTTDGANLYVTDSNNHMIRKIVVATGEAAILAGSGTHGTLDATGRAASFNLPTDITTFGGNLYVADTGSHTIRKIIIDTGDVSTLAGSGMQGAFDAAGKAASFNQPRGITTDGVNLYVADTGNNTIRKIVISTGIVTTLAGTGKEGAADGTGAAASFNQPRGIVTDGLNLYVADSENHKIRKIVIATATVTTMAGSGTPGTADGASMAAAFHTPQGITTDGSNLYVTDTGNHTIRKIVIANAIVTTLAGSGASDAADGASMAAAFHSPQGITTDGRYLYVADTANNRIRIIQ